MKNKIKQQIRSKFVWKPGADRFFKGANPTSIGTTLVRHRDENGGELPPDLIVAKAEDPLSPLHQPIYEGLDDTDAAHLHRLERARLLLRYIFVVEKVEGREFTMRISEKVERPGGDTPPRWISTRDAMSDPEYREGLLKNALREAMAFRRKYAELSELAIVFATIETTVRKIQTRR